MALEEHGDHPKEEVKSGGMTHRRGRHKRGGKTEEGREKINLYNAEGSPEAKEAENEKPEFRKGGRAKHASGGMIGGEREEVRADKHPRGRAKRAAGGRAMEGGSPYSSGRALSGEKSGGAMDGHEGQKVPSEPG